MYLSSFPGYLLVGSWAAVQVITAHSWVDQVFQLNAVGFPQGPPGYIRQYSTNVDNIARSLT